MASSSRVDTKGMHVEEESTALAQITTPPSIASTTADADNGLLQDAPVYRVYRRRFFGLLQLIVLNIIISWDWLTFSPVSDLSAQWFGVSESAINWLSTAVLFAFVAMTPVTLWLLNKGGPSQAIRGAGILVVIGNWIRFGGTRSGRFGVTMFGQIIIGFAQPLVLTAPTRYSNMWFSDRGRVTATAVASLANPLGGALGQLIGPLWANQPSQIPDLVLWTAILSSVIALTGLFTPVAPPTPPSASAAQPKLELVHSLKQLPRNAVFWLIAVPFVVYVGLFNAISTLLNQIFEPYGYSDDDAGIAGGILIIVGLLAAAVTSPIIDRTKLFLWAIRLLVPVVAVTYIALTFMPQTREITGPWIICAVLGAASFSLLPVVLEYMTIVTHPISPEISSVVVWSGSQLSGAIFILIMDALKASRTADPPYNMYYALVFAAVIACAAWPFPMAIGLLPSTRAPGRDQLRP